MRELFRGHYQPDDEELKDLWQEGLIVLDTNVLLSLYEYSESTRSALLRLLNQNCHRVWIPYQVAQEFQRNRHSRISQGLENRRDASLTVEQLRGSIVKWFDPVDPSVQKALDTVERFVSERLAIHESTVGGEQGTDDDIRSDLDKILAGRIGDAPSPDWLDTSIATAAKRAEAKLPPGYEDHGKSDGREAGDYLLWFQLLEHAESMPVPVILVTEERKADWWLKHKGKTVGPRPELVEEFWERVGRPFWLYRTDSFLLAARKFLRNDISDEAVSEVKLVSDRLVREDEQYRASAAERIRRGSPANRVRNYAMRISELQETIEELQVVREDIAREQAELDLEQDALRGLPAGGDGARESDHAVRLDVRSSLLNQKRTRAEGRLANLIAERDSYIARIEANRRRTSRSRNDDRTLGGTLPGQSILWSAQGEGGSILDHERPG